MSIHDGNIRGGPFTTTHHGCNNRFFNINAKEKFAGTKQNKDSLRFWWYCTSLAAVSLLLPLCDIDLAEHALEYHTAIIPI
jgi:hypothetical protein